MERMRMEVWLHSVKVERGHDGLFRGRPEPVLVVAGIAVGQSVAVTLGCTLQPLKVNRPIPCRIAPREPTPLLSITAPDPSRLVLLLLAFESDSGKDVDSLSRALSLTDDWKVRAVDSSMAAPFRLSELGLCSPHEPPNAQRVRISYRDQDLAQCCKKDDWVGAAMAVLPAAPLPRTRWALHLVSDDRRNDWLAEVSTLVW